MDGGQMLSANVACSCVSSQHGHLLCYAVQQVNRRHASPTLSSDLSSDPALVRTYLRTMTQLATRAAEQSPPQRSSTDAGAHSIDQAVCTVCVMISCFAGKAALPEDVRCSSMLTKAYACNGVLRTGAPERDLLAEGRYISALLAACGDDLLPFVQLYHRLLSAAPAGRSQLVSALAFGCSQLLPRLWRSAPCFASERPSHVNTHTQSSA